MPDAGKSSLLGALAQAAHTQARALRGRLTDLTHGLGELRNRVYDDRQRETQEEIVPYPVRFDPYGGAPPRPAILYDCDGRAANDFLTSKRSLEKEGRAGALAHAVLSADALILTIDASAPHTQIEDDFREFLRFLRYLQTYRSREHAVGGLPVYLVLTKCDLLARESMGRAAWEERIAERKQDVVKRFKQFLAAERTADEFAFGTIDLDVRATAVRHPALADAAPLPREPFGVAELFHEAFGEATAFQRRRTRSQKRLTWTVAGASGFLAAMALAGAIFLTTPTGPGAPTLADRVETVRASEGPTAATRLGPNLDERLKQWLEIQSHPDFPELPEDLQNYVRVRLDEGHAYVQFRDDLAAIPPPTRARALAELAQIEARIAQVKPPEAYQGEWAPTEAVQNRERLLTQVIPTLRDAVGRLNQFYFTLKNRATNLLQTSELNPEWEQAVRDLEAAAGTLPIPKAEPLRGLAYEYDDVAIAAADWQRTHDRLAQLRDVATALGLLGHPAGPKTPLALAPPPADADIPELARRRLQDLKAQYPDFAKWSLAQFPDAVRPELERRLRQSIEQANRDGQRIVLDRYMSLNTSGREEPTDWPRVGEYLLSPPLQEWRELVGFLNRMLDPTAENPAEATAAFLRRTSFELDPRRIRVRIPDTLSDSPIRPAGDLVLAHRPAAGGEPARLSLRPDGEPQRDKQTLVYTFVGSGPAITYRPGDTFFAELPVRKGDRDLKLTWASSRTMSFQFERLAREPRLHAPEQSNVEGLLASGVTAAVTDGAFPVVPPMVPVVRFEKK
jgi:hypothetical protein